MSQKQIAAALAGKFEKVRESLGYGVSEMSKALNMYRGNYYDYENGKVLPSLVTLFRIGFRLNISLNWLLLDKGPMVIPSDEEIKKASSTPLDGLENPLTSDTIELIRTMDKNPLLRHEILLQFHRFKEEHPDGEK